MPKSALGSVQKNLPIKSQARITSLDLLKGTVMILMALDHVRDYFHYDAFLYVPTDLSQTNPYLFFTRFITHYCAPVFMFLAGTSAFLVGRRLPKKELSKWLIKRGIWLIILELTVIKLAWYFKFNFHLIDFMVIWALGACMILLAGIIYLPKNWAIAISILGILSHNLLDGVSFDHEVINIIWIFLHQFAPIYFGEVEVFVSYPLIPWIFVMPLGYYFGELYRPSFPENKRRKILLTLGVGMTAGFFILRGINLYGDPNPWKVMDTFNFTLLSFFNVQKYPPSLLYLLITMGPSMILLLISERWKNRFLDKIILIGRVPMFYYLVHLFVIHGLACIAAMLTGYEFTDMVLDRWITEVPELKGYGFGLPVVYAVWVLVIIIHYPVCKKYYRYKSANRDKWWLSYL